MRRYRRKSTKKNKRRRRRRTRNRKGGVDPPTTVQKIVHGKQLRECKEKVKMMKKKINEFRALSTSNLAVERENVDHVLEEANKIVEDFKKTQDIIEKHYNKGSNMESLVKELSENKLY